MISNHIKVAIQDFTRACFYGGERLGTGVDMRWLVSCQDDRKPINIGQMAGLPIKDVNAIIHDELKRIAEAVLNERELKKDCPQGQVF
ncbi:hypothetical protein [Aeromonas hydrophila]|nr:hypothetical protein [Aeromonas hydrophila]AGM44169.1 hypothetical protein AHML_11945 [Aeromonas hydrophila ML09-119]AHX32842.1 hypothetical protein V428_12330 [Aeromonas hydrophila subsp. hydrophila AL09-71]AHX69640.1 hypothetical protein V429_12345 [Aeromonas hydrophila pc104A]AJE38619.1 hypothetical protein V469_10730 [Aeromonas hydrophila J-1]AKJ37047.1 hypothetical protein U876_11140 [Aeromonas hydrophila NJ-35]